MSIFHKRNTLVENITYMALMAAINVIFVLLTFFVPFLLFLLVFILPLSSAIVAIYCKKRYYIFYAIATIGICMLVTVTNFADTIFFVIPSVITGFLFGLLIERKIPSIIVIATATLAQVLLSYPGLWIGTQLIYPGQEDIFVVLSKMIGLEGYIYLDYIKHLSILLISLIQETIAFIVIKEESNKLGVKLETKGWMDKLLPNLLIMFFSILSLIFAFAYKPLAYVFMGGSAFFGIYQTAILIIEKKNWIYFSLAGVLLTTIFVFAACYSVIPEPLGFITLQIMFVAVGIIGLLNNYLVSLLKKR